MSDPSLRVTVLPDPGPGAVSAAGPLRSVQEAELAIEGGPAERLWEPATLEQLARAYWSFLEGHSIGLLRVVSGDSSRSVTLLSPRLVLLRFRAPRYQVGPDFGRVTWPIARGILVAREGRGRGYLRFDVRGPAEPGGAARIRAEVSNFYPWLRGSGRLRAVLYAQTQARLHTWVTRGFLRSLERLELPRGASGPAPG
jgi:hypothetical protein